MLEVCAASNLNVPSRKQIEKIAEDKYGMSMTPVHFVTNVLQIHTFKESLLQLMKHQIRIIFLYI